MNTAALLVRSARQRDVDTNAVSRRSKEVAPAEPFASRLARSAVKPRDPVEPREQRDPAEPRPATDVRKPQGAPSSGKPAAEHDSSVGAAAEAVGVVEDDATESRLDALDRPATQPTAPTPAAAPSGVPSLPSVGENTILLSANSVAEVDATSVNSSSEETAPMVRPPSGSEAAGRLPLEPSKPTTAGTDGHVTAPNGEKLAASPFSRAVAQDTPAEAEIAGRVDTNWTKRSNTDPASSWPRSDQPGSSAASVNAVDDTPNAASIDAGPNADANASKLADAAGKALLRVNVTPSSDAATSSPSPAQHVAPLDVTKGATVPALAQSTPQQPASVANDEDAFARQNIERIVNGVRGELLPRGGSMQLRLDPPQLGSLHVSVRVQDGVLSASFQTSSEQATQMLSQTMTQLKSALEASGVSVERLHVQQAPASRTSDDSRGSTGDGRHHQGGGEHQSWAQSEQQRREMLQRMWRRLGIGDDPLDLVA
jgi:flagellar hook-length control protein FliK